MDDKITQALRRHTLDAIVAYYGADYDSDQISGGLPRYAALSGDGNTIWIDFYATHEDTQKLVEGDPTRFWPFELVDLDTGNVSKLDLKVVIGAETGECYQSEPDECEFEQTDTREWHCETHDITCVGQRTEPVHCPVGQALTERDAAKSAV